MAIATLAAQDNPLIVDTVRDGNPHAARLTAHAAGRPAPAQSRSAQPEMPQTPDQHQNDAALLLLSAAPPCMRDTTHAACHGSRAEHQAEQQRPPTILAYEGPKEVNCIRCVRKHIEALDFLPSDIMFKSLLLGFKRLGIPQDRVWAWPDRSGHQGCQG